jgi:O-antigen/teichoic acid export membrane protein
MVGVLMVVFATAASSLLGSAFDHQGLLLVSLALAFTGYYVMHMAWGLLAGTGRYRAYGLVTGTEGAARGLFAMALLAFGVRSVGPYGLAIGVAPFLAAVVGLRYGWGGLEPGPEEPLGPTARAVGYLVVGSFVGQFVMMIGPLLVKVLAHPGQQDQAARFLAGLTLTRVPLFLLNAVLIALLPRLTRLVHQGLSTQFRQTVWWLVLLLTGLFAAGTLLAAAIGPSIMRILFGPGYVLSAASLAILEGACGAFIVSVVLAYGLIAISRQLWATMSTLLGCLVFGFVTITGGRLGLVGRVEWALLVGSCASALCAATLLRVADRRQVWAMTPQRVEVLIPSEVPAAVSPLP